jgi:hypothetical protein
MRRSSLIWPFLQGRKPAKSRRARAFGPIVVHLPQYWPRFVNGSRYRACSVNCNRADDLCA